MCQPLNGRIPKSNLKRQENQVRNFHFVLWWWKLTSVQNSMGSNLEPADFLCFMATFRWLPKFLYSFDPIDRAWRYFSCSFQAHCHFRISFAIEFVWPIWESSLEWHFNNKLEHTAFVVHQPTLVSLAFAGRRHINFIHESWHLENHKIYHRHWCALYTPRTVWVHTIRRDLFWWAF